MADSNRSIPHLNALAQLAALHGIQTHYRSMAHRRVESSPDSILATLRALGVEVESLADCAEALRLEHVRHSRQPLEPVMIAWNGRCPAVTLTLPADALEHSAELEVTLEGGGSICRSVRLNQSGCIATRTVDGTQFSSCSLRIPGRLATGYHDLTVKTSIGRFQARILSAPVRTYAPGTDEQSWGLFAPLYALRSHHNWGAGDYSDLEAFAAWTGRHGGRVAATLPLLPLFLDDPMERSPYSPVSRLFWSEFHLDLEGVPELINTPSGSRELSRPGIRERIEQFRTEPLVNYHSILALKRELLLPCAHRFFRTPSARRDTFERFRRQQPHLDSYASFRALQETLSRDWHRWPTRLRAGTLPERYPSTVAREYHLYAQWLAHQQMARAARTAHRHEVELYLDLPLGAHPAGYDAWRFQSVFARGATGGAPPDPVFTQGQDWGFAPLHPAALRASGYRYLVDCLRHHLQVARMLRFDHVMALHRLYWIPSGLPASAGVYVTCPAEELYAVLSIESHRHQARIIGENLGTVPPEVDRSLRRHGVRGMHVVQYELRPDAQRPLPQAPRHSVASLNTHDMSPFAAYWHGLDIFDRFGLGLLTQSGVRSEQRRRQRIRQSLQRWLKRCHGRPGEDMQTSAVFLALLAQLRASPAEVVLVNVEDAWLETLPQNVPGTTHERVNWQRKVRFPIESWNRLSAIRQMLETIHPSRPSTQPGTQRQPRHHASPAAEASPTRPRSIPS